MAATQAKRQSNRWPALLDAAAREFAERGYHATTMRELAAAVEMTPGAIYFHVPTKQHLLVAVYEEGVRRILGHLDAALEGATDAWTRLEAAIRAHLESILDASAFARVVIRVLPEDVPEVAADLIALRDRYEGRLRRLLEDVELPSGRDPRLSRLFLIGAMNWTPVWYRGDGSDLPLLVQQLMAPLRSHSIHSTGERT